MGDNMEFGKNLKAILEFEGIKQKEFAEMLHISPSTMNGYLNDKRQPDFDLVMKMANALNVSVDYLFGGECGDKPVLSESELALLTSFRRMPPEQQKVFMALAKMLADSSGKK